MNLYHCAIRPELEDIAFVGLYRPLFFCAVELQAILAVKYFLKKINIDKEKMTENLESKRKVRRGVEKPKFSGDCVDFSDSIAKDLGMFPNLEEIQQKDAELYDMLMNGPLLNLHYYVNNDDDFIKDKAIRNIKKINNELRSNSMM